MTETALAFTAEPEPDALSRHERKDVNTLWIVATAAMLTAEITIVCLASWWTLAGLTAPAMPSTPAELMAVAARRLPPQPRLEGLIDLNDPSSSSSLAWRELQAAHVEYLKNYGWVDQEKRIVHIPIEMAMQLIIDEKLLPAAETPSARTSPSPKAQP